MNNCKKYIEQINMYLDGELKASLISELLEHINCCPDCKKRFEALKIISFQIRDAEESLPTNLHSTIMAHINDNASPKNAKKRLQLGSLGAIAAMLFLVFAGGFLNLNSTLIFGNDSLSKSDSSTPSMAAQNAAPQQPKTGLRSVPAADSEPTDEKSAANGNSPAAFSINPAAQNESGEGTIAGSGERIDVVTDEVVAYYRLFKGKQPAPDFVEEYVFYLSEKETDHEIYYIYVDNKKGSLEALHTRLEDAGFVDKGEIQGNNPVDAKAEFGLVILVAE